MCLLFRVFMKQWGVLWVHALLKKPGFNVPCLGKCLCYVSEDR